MQETLRFAVERAAASDYFTGARLPEDLERFIAAQGDACRALAGELHGAVDRLYLVGSGGSYADAVQAKYLLDRLLDVPVESVASYELIWRRPRALGPRSAAFFISLSGETEDTVAALRAAREHGARTVAIARSADSTLGREADVCLPYDSAACYEAPVVALALVGCGLAQRGGDAAEADAILASLAGVPDAVRAAMAAEAEVAEQKARRFLSSTHLYVVGAGPLSSLAYKVGLTVVMENVRIGATAVDASEFRHGPAEALERTRPDMLFLVGTDESREMTLRTLAFCEREGARTLVYDAADHPPVHPLLTGLVLNPLTQWFVVYSAILRGIVDLDERVFMGHQVLADGGARWP